MAGSPNGAPTRREFITGRSSAITAGIGTQMVAAAAGTAALVATLKRLSAGEKGCTFEQLEREKGHLET